MTKKIFSKIEEREISEAICNEFFKDLRGFLYCDVIIVGGGPAGLVAGWKLAEKKVKTLLVERNNYLGGGFWSGGYFFNKLTFRKPGEKILKELGVSFKEYKKGLFVTDSPLACSKLIAKACEAGLKFLNLTFLEDIILKENKVKGVVINWTAVNYLPKEISCLDPLPLESRLVIDATGHDALVSKKLSERGLIKISNFGVLDIKTSEDLILKYTKEIFPGLIVSGMSVATVFGLPRMGPTFASMLLSGEKAAKIALKKLKK